MPRGPLTPGVISPRRKVPAAIPRPEYVDRPAPAPYTGPEVKSADILERMRVAGRPPPPAPGGGGRHIAPGGAPPPAAPGGPPDPPPPRPAPPPPRPPRLPPTP